MSKLGNKLVYGVGNLSLEAIKRSLSRSFIDYKECILRNEEPSSNSWFFLLDLIACRWGYYGDLDYYIDDMEARLDKTIKSFQKRKQIDAFLMDIGAYKENQDRAIRELEEQYACMNMHIISI